MKINIEKQELQILTKNIIQRAEKYNIDNLIATINLKPIDGNLLGGTNYQTDDTTIKFEIEINDADWDNLTITLIHEFGHVLHFSYIFRLYQNPESFNELLVNTRNSVSVRLLEEYIAQRFAYEESNHCSNIEPPNDSAMYTLAYTIALEHSNGRPYNETINISNRGIALLDEFYILVTKNIEIPKTSYQLKLTELSKEISL